MKKRQCAQKEPRRIVIEKIDPLIDNGKFPVKRSEGELINVSADIYADGHDTIKAAILYREKDQERYLSERMQHICNDRWEGCFEIKERSGYFYSIQAWVDHFATWRTDMIKKLKAGEEDQADKRLGADLINKAAKQANKSAGEALEMYAELLLKETEKTHLIDVLDSPRLLNLMDEFAEKSHLTKNDREIFVDVERKKTLFSSWYEFFPRSFAKNPGEHGTFKDCENLLPYIAEMGFDVIYLPPIHPIGKTARKGKNNSPSSVKGDVGSPWAIGSKKGGHMAINPKLGTLDDLQRFIRKANENGMEIALDFAFQCSRDHPYLKEHPEWFKWRPDGSIQFAENPPKKYEDIVPISFDTDDREKLWEELKNVAFYWLDQGVKIFRVDNPHTKPFAFWEWLIMHCRQKCPEVIFLAEAFTRPKIMKHLAKVGFSQSYSYFTWRNTKNEFIEYMNELTQSDSRNFMRPNFWPNTPDILPEHLQQGNRSAFILRLVLAGTLSSNYGIYGPAYELCENQALPGKEEYRNSEKYELKRWDMDRPGNIRRIVARLNHIRKENAALHDTFNIRFCNIENDQILCYIKMTSDKKNVIVIAANMDQYHTQSGWVDLPLEELGIGPDESYTMHELISEDKYTWIGRRNFIELNPNILPIHIFRLQRKTGKEQNFDNY